MFASLNKSNGINNIGRNGNYFSGYMSDDDGDGKYTFKNTFKGKGSNNINNVGRSGSKYSTFMFDDDGDGEFTFKSTTFKGEGSIGRNGNTYFGDYASDTDEDGIYEFKNTFKGKDSIGRKGDKKTNKIPFYEDLKENYAKNKNLFNNVTVSKLEREMEIETTFDNPKYDHRRADFDKPEYKPFVDTIEQNKNATNGITNKRGVRSTTFKKISGTVEALKNA
jgi:hypothetical protein